jgi:hypothetical protein
MCIVIIINTEPQVIIFVFKYRFLFHWALSMSYHVQDTRVVHVKCSLNQCPSVLALNYG